MSETVTTTVRHLLPGDVAVGSGFVVNRRPWAGVHTPKGRVVVEGNYPNAPIRAYHWTPSTSITVLRSK